MPTDEQDAPTRAEVEAILFSSQGMEREDRVAGLSRFLSKRGLEKLEVEKVLLDLESYQNWSE